MFPSFLSDGPTLNVQYFFAHETLKFLPILSDGPASSAQAPFLFTLRVADGPTSLAHALSHIPPMVYDYPRSCAHALSHIPPIVDYGQKSCAYSLSRIPPMVDDGPTICEMLAFMFYLPVFLSAFHYNKLLHTSMGGFR